MYILNLNISYFKPVGEISDSRIQLLKEKLSAFPEIEKPAKDIIVFKSGNSGYAIHPGQITFIANGVAELKPDEVIDTLNTINETLGLSDEAKLLCVFEGISQCNGSSMSFSSEIHKTEAETLSAKGIGLRFMVETSVIKGDVRIEPFLKDENKIFYHTVLESKELISLSRTKEVLRDIINVATVKALEVSARLFNS